MTIEKLATSTRGLLRPSGWFPSARAAFRAYLRAAELGPGEHVLLPSFIGWSPREGSGVFDPVAELGLPCRFYRMDARLEIDLESLRRCFMAGGVKVMVLIHYFGRPDPACAEAVAMARSFGALVLEDEAHALFTDVVGGAAGRMGDASIYSLHKMLPVPTGGMLVLAEPEAPCAAALAEAVPPEGPALWEWDLAGMAERRVRNAAALRSLLEPLAGEVDPLWAEAEPGVVPQTLPVLIRGASRDALYFRMNQAGFGVVSLYHTLIDRLGAIEFPDAHALSRCILNLPVHHDASEASLAAMVRELAAAVRQAGEAAVRC